MKTLAVIAPTYMQMKGFLPAFVNCLICNIEYQNKFVSFNSDDFTAYIGHDGPSIDGTKEYMSSIIEKYPNNFIYFETETRINNFGHNIRQQALQMCKEEIVMFQNADNLICAATVRIITDIYKEQKPDLIVSAISHSYRNFEYFSGEKLSLCEVDFANITVRTELAKKIGISNEFGADGHFCKNLKQRFPNLKIVKTSAILCIHQ